MLRAVGSRRAWVIWTALALLSIGVQGSFLQSRASAQVQSRASAQAVATQPSRGERAVLVRMLEEGRSFRVRARAAVALDRFTDTDVLVALEGALRDPHVAVRTAAAHSLAAVGQRRSVSALRDAARDSSSAVATEAKSALAAIAERNLGQPALASAAIEAAVSSTGVMTRLRRAQHVVVVGEMQDRSPGHSKELSQVLAEQVASALTKLDRVAVLRPHELTDQARSEIARKKLPVLRLEGNVQSIQHAIEGDERRVRCEVSVLLLDDASRALRSMMRGAASAVAQLKGSPLAQEQDLTRKALRGAVKTAMSSATEAIVAGASEVSESEQASLSLRKSGRRKSGRHN